MNRTRTLSACAAFSVVIALLGIPLPALADNPTVVETAETAEVEVSETAVGDAANNEMNTEGTEGDESTQLEEDKFTAAVLPAVAEVRYPAGAAFRIEASDPEVIASYQWIANNGSEDFELDGTTVDLAQSDVLVETEQKPGLMAQSEGGVTVVLDTNLTDDLILEGYARELISKVQTLRKESGLELTDRIRLTVSGSGKIAKALNACGDMIRKAVLATELSASETPDEAGKETDLNGEKVTLRLEKE